MGLASDGNWELHLGAARVWALQRTYITIGKAIQIVRNNK